MQREKASSKADARKPRRREISPQFAPAMNFDQEREQPPARQKSVKRTELPSYPVTTIVWFLSVLFLVNQVGCRTIAPSDTTNAQSDPHVKYHWSCGLNVAYVTLRLFHRDVEINELANELTVGAFFEQDASFLNLVKAFEKYGLIAKGFKADYPQEIIEFAGPENVLIVRVNCNGRDRVLGHFIVIKGTQDGFILIDPPYHPKKFTRQDATEGKVLSDASGEFLVVNKPKRS